MVYAKRLSLYTAKMYTQESFPNVEMIISCADLENYVRGVQLNSDNLIVDEGRDDPITTRSGPS